MGILSLRSKWSEDRLASLGAYVMGVAETDSASKPVAAYDRAYLGVWSDRGLHLPTFPFSLVVSGAKTAYRGWFGASGDRTSNFRFRGLGLSPSAHVVDSAQAERFYGAIAAWDRAGFTMIERLKWRAHLPASSRAFVVGIAQVLGVNRPAAAFD